MKLSDTDKKAVATAEKHLLTFKSSRTGGVSAAFVIEGDGLSVIHSNASGPCHGWTSSYFGTKGTRYIVSSLRLFPYGSSTSRIGYVSDKYVTFKDAKDFAKMADQWYADLLSSRFFKGIKDNSVILDGSTPSEERWILIRVDDTNRWLVPTFLIASRNAHERNIIQWGVPSASSDNDGISAWYHLRYNSKDPLPMDVVFTLGARSGFNQSSHMVTLNVMGHSHIPLDGIPKVFPPKPSPDLNKTNRYDFSRNTFDFVSDKDLKAAIDKVNGVSSENVVRGYLSPVLYYGMYSEGVDGQLKTKSAFYQNLALCHRSKARETMISLFRELYGKEATDEVLRSNP